MSTRKDPVWGTWKLNEDGRKYRPGGYDGQIRYWQYDHERGVITDEKGIFLTAEQSKVLLDHSTPRSSSTQGVFKQAKDSQTKSQHAAPTKRRDSGYSLVTSPLINRPNDVDPRGSASSLGYSNPYYTPAATAPAVNPLHRAPAPHALFGHPQPETTARDAVGTAMSGRSRKEADENELSQGASTAVVGGREVQVIPPGSKPPADTKDVEHRNGNIYFYDRHHVILAVARSNGKPRDRAARADEILGEMKRLEVRDATVNNGSVPRENRHAPVLIQSGYHNSELKGDSFPESQSQQYGQETQPDRHSVQTVLQPLTSTSQPPESPPISKQFPANQNQNMKKIQAVGRGDTEELDSRYIVRHSNFFSKGRVFAMLWHESDTSQHATDAGEKEGPQYSVGRFNQRIYTTVRRMVVVRVAEGYCLCSPIVTYTGRGTTKPGLHETDIKHHTVIYMDNTMPIVEKEEQARGMSKDPIAVQPAKPDQKLWPKSRLNLNKIYAVEHNVKVMNVGMIRGVHLQTLTTYHHNTFSPPEQRK